MGDTEADERGRELIRDELEALDKDEIIELIIVAGKKELRNTNYAIALIRERMTHFERAIQELEESIAENKIKANKYRSMGNDPERAIKALRRIIENNQKRIAELQKQVNAFEDKKKKKAVEQLNAKKEINKKLTKSVYNFLSKDSDQIIIRLVEAFTAMLRNRPEANREDVEIYFKKYEGLLTAMNKVNPREISGSNAKIYTDTVQAIRNEFSGEHSKYHKYIPFLVFLNQTCSIVSLTIEEKQIEAEIVDLEQDSKQREKEIEEIETFNENVRDLTDYDALVKQEENQLNLLLNHYDILKARAAKLGKYSKLFQKYYFQEIDNPKLLSSTKVERIDKMDDIHKIKTVARPVNNEAPVAKQMTRVPVKLRVDKSDDESDAGSYEESKDEESKQEDSSEYNRDRSDSADDRSRSEESQDEQPASDEEDDSYSRG